MGPAHAQAFEVWAANNGETTEVSYAASQISGFLFRAAQYTEAERLMRRALRIDERCYGESHPDVARDVSNLAQLLKATNRLAEWAPLDASRTQD